MTSNRTGSHGNRWVKWIIVLLVLVAIAAIVGWYSLFREVPQPAFASMDDTFKYGSIGAENEQGLPYWVWFILPKVFPEYLPSPGGYASLGMPWERAAAMPVGFSKKTIGFDRVAINCGFCHTGSYRASDDSQPVILPGGPSHTFDVLAYERFLFKCASDPRFNATVLLNAIGGVYDMPLGERLLYRFILIPQTRTALLKQRDAFEWTNTRPPWGHGRIDPFNPVKIAILNLTAGDTIGNSDMMSIWGLQGTANEAYHWDGLNTNLVEVYRSSALGDGASQKSIPLEHMDKLRTWMATVKPPKYPFPMNAALAAQGSTVFAQHCAQCHGPNGAGLGTIVPIDVVGTDRHRLDMWSEDAAKNYNAYVKKPWKFSHFRKTNGYMAVSFHGLWLRGPFLHNGSVPSLRALLMPPAERPKQFYRGNDVFDPQNVGFISDKPVAHGVHFTLHDTTQPGNSNAGHTFGTDLDAASKEALLEFLKTL